MFHRRWSETLPPGPAKLVRFVLTYEKVPNSREGRGQRTSGYGHRGQAVCESAMAASGGIAIPRSLADLLVGAPSTYKNPRKAAWIASGDFPPAVGFIQRTVADDQLRAVARGPLKSFLGEENDGVGMSRTRPAFVFGVAMPHSPRVKMARSCQRWSNAPRSCWQRRSLCPLA